MYSNKTLLAVLLVIFCTNCTNKNTGRGLSEVIEINPHEALESINLSEIADSVICIRLETNNDDIMGRTREIVIKKKHIYAMDVSQQIIFVFDKKGEYIAKLDKRGAGADEYQFMGPVFIDDNEEYIEVIDYRGKESTKLKYTNLSFDLLESVPFPKVRCNSCKRNAGFYYFSTQQMDNIVDNKKTNAGLITYQEEEGVRSIFEKDIDSKNISFSPNIESFTINENNEIYFSLMYDNIFYRLNGNEAHPALTVDFGKYNMNNSVGQKPMDEQMRYIQGMNGLASFPVLNINNSDIMAFSYYFKQDDNERMYREGDFRQYIKLKKSNKIFHVKKIKNDLSDFPTHMYISSYFFNCAHEVLYDNYLVDVIVPNYYFANAEDEKVYVDGIGEITAYDNPVIVMMRLKK